MSYLPFVPGQLAGTVTNDNAATGNVGEWISAVSNVISAGTTATWSNATSINLTAGDWDVSGLLAFNANGATITVANSIELALSKFSGSTTTDHVLGDNVLAIGVLGATQDIGSSIPSWRVSLSGAQTVYLKGNITYSAGTPRMYGRISARRMR